MRDIKSSSQSVESTAVFWKAAYILSTKVPTTYTLHYYMSIHRLGFLFGHRRPLGSVYMTLSVLLVVVHVRLLGILGSSTAVSDLRHLFLQSSKSSFGIPVPWRV